MDLSKYNAKPNKTIKEHTDEVIDSLNQLLHLGYIDESLYPLVYKACMHHDYGKVNREFQKRVNDKEKKLRFNQEKEIAHNVLSLYFIKQEEFDTEDDYLKVAHAVINHHNYCDVYKTLDSKRELIQSLLQEFEFYKVRNKIIKKLSTIIEDPESIKIKGFLHKCDYSASAGIMVEYPNDFLNQGLDCLMSNWKKRDENIRWNTLQEFCEEYTNHNIIAIAQTGMGKTEAGLRWIGNHKGYFILPIRTAINAMYDRVLKIVGKGQCDTKLAMLHSTSLEYYVHNKVDEQFDIFEYERRGKQLSIPLSISTMDQLFDFVFKYQGFELKLTTLSYSKIVIDEIQMYGPDVLAYLIYGIKKIYELGGKIAIVTATFSPFLENLLSPIPFEKRIFMNNQKRHYINVLQKKLVIDEIITVYRKNTERMKSNKMLVVLNTVRKAQEIYKELNNISELKGKVHILHSQFTKEERKKKEEEILAYGTTFDIDGNIDTNDDIWVSTSLVEASLDIDFDYLFTELQDLNSLFQRMGRCNRKGVKGVEEANCFVYTEIDKTLLRHENKGFIDKMIYEQSKKAIKELHGIISEQEKHQLIEDYFKMDDLKESDFIRQYDAIYKLLEQILPYQYEKESIRLRNILSENILPSPIYEKYQKEIRESEARLLSAKLTKEERILEEDNIRKYTVSIQSYQIWNYESAVRNGIAECYALVKLSEYEKIKVIECSYDDSGFSKIDYKKIIRPSN